MAKKGYGTKLYYGNDKATATTQIATVVEVTPPNTKVEAIDVSHLLSPDEFVEKEPGWKDAGDIELTIQFADAQAETIWGLVGVNKGFKIEFPGGSTWTCDGFISGYGDEVERKGIVTTKITITVDGKPVYTKATP